MEKIIKLFNTKNFPFRLLFGILAVVPLVFYQDFIVHISSHFTGSILPNIITQQWHIALLNIILFMTFLIPLSFRRKVNWKEYSLVTAFFVSLFIEMYGIPLTVLFASRSFANSENNIPNVIYQFDFFGTDIKMSVAMVYGTLLMVLGTLLIIIAWVTLYKNYRDDSIVTNGIYSYSRHPQYLGFILIITGWLIGWTTFLTVIFGPILISVYVYVCKIEEKELSKSNKKEYEKYKKSVPFFI